MTDDSYCSFCLKPAAEVSKLISGAGVYICDGCVSLCGEILAGQHEPATPEVTLWDRKSDEEILQSIPRMAMVSAQTDARIQAQVDLLRTRGVAWARIGEALGVTRQSAWERFSADK
ncbi:ClpX C4-type zinc finger protein [Amycolatopsis rhabdoformis]|uniref:ClpX C4-type zinc finger protein n=1 Tax=Amycolatopsis rhabdoformis TaxID=1448059 RepID=A0ABZ1I783_9PSEU|nr:ClpX C4-type zinc finger protein [Amycolatopsis rhabdoformis]WSE29500.1 ClpX C4-type zinc finger protein [Amycolatopsis rhabdoformis]